jgi:chorismate-pyruvate lyase
MAAASHHTPSLPRQSLAPLLTLFERKGVRACELLEVADSRVPEPYRELLVHDRNMTPTLERFFGARVCLDVLDCDHEPARSELRRWVLLRLEPGAKSRVVALGCVTINLAALPRAVAEEVLQGKRPLGTLLLEAKVKQRCRPVLFFSAPGDHALLAQLLCGSREAPPSSEGPDRLPPERFYGRCNRITGESEAAVIAEVVEILAPVE